jgi:hypothetical protein
MGRKKKASGEKEKGGEKILISWYKRGVIYW